MNINGKIIIGNWLKHDIWANISDSVVLIYFQMTHKQNPLVSDQRGWFSINLSEFLVLSNGFPHHWAAGINYLSELYFCPLPPTNNDSCSVCKRWTSRSGFFLLLFEREFFSTVKFLLKWVCVGWAQFQMSAQVCMCRHPSSPVLCSVGLHVLVVRCCSVLHSAALGWKWWWEKVLFLVYSMGMRRSRT